MTALTAILRDLTERYAVPGAGVGLVADGRVETAFTGVISVDDPLEVDDRTLFQIGSVSKTYTATAVLALVTEGRVGLDHRVREYVPELRLADEQVAADVTMRHLLNHTAGWDGTLSSGDGDPDEPLSSFVATTLPTLEQVGPLGRRAEYNNAAVALAGRVVERVTGEPFEQAIRSLLLAPLGLSDTHFTIDDLVTERCTVGHLADGDGAYRVARPWRWPRAGNPEGGLVSTLRDQLGWARLHLTDGRTADGTPVLEPALAVAMRTPTVPLLGNPMGDAVGLGWFLHDVGGEATVTHSGSTNGQFTELRLVPGRDVGVIACANGGPAGSILVRELVAAVLDDRFGLRPAPRSYRPFDPARDGDVGGTYVNDLASLEVTLDADGVRLEFELGPAYATSLADPPTFAPAPLRFLADRDGEYVVGAGAFEGDPGAFVRTGNGEVGEVAFGGRWYRRAGP